MNLMNILLGISTALAEEGVAVSADATGELAEGAGAVGTVAALISTLLPMVLIFVVFYFFLIRPQRKKDKQVKQMLDNLKVTDRICTIGGIYGTITNIKDDTITLSVGNQNMTMVVARWAIRSVEEVSIENDSEMLN